MSTKDLSIDLSMALERPDDEAGFEQPGSENFDPVRVIEEALTKFYKAVRKNVSKAQIHNSAEKYYNQTYVLFLMLKKKYGSQEPVAIAQVQRDIAAMIADQSVDKKKLEQDLIVYFSVVDPLKSHQSIRTMATNFRFCPYRLASRLEKEYMSVAPTTTKDICEQLNRNFNRDLHRRTLSDTERANTAAAAAVYASLDTRQKIRYLISKYDPAKQQATEEMLVRFAGREETLLRGVEERFGIDSGTQSKEGGLPSTMVPATPRLLAAAAAAAQEVSRIDTPPRSSTIRRSVLIVLVLLLHSVPPH